MPSLCQNTPILAVLLLLLLTITTALPPISHDRESGSSLFQGYRYTHGPDIEKVLNEQRDNSTSLSSSDSTSSKARLNIAWVYQGDHMPDNVVKHLLNTGMSQIYAEEADWVETVVQLPSGASFGVVPDQGAQYNMDWRDALDLARGMKAKMAEEGYYERIGIIYLAGKRIGEMGVYWDDYLLKIGNTTNPTTTANAANTTDIATTAPTHTGEGDVSLHVQSENTTASAGNMTITLNQMGNITTTLKHDLDNIRLAYKYRGVHLDEIHCLRLLKGAMGAAGDEITEGKGDDPVGWEELRYQGVDILLVVRTDPKATHLMTWSMALRVEQLLVGQIAKRGYKEWFADVIWLGNDGGLAEVIGKLRLMRR